MNKLFLFFPALVALVACNQPNPDKGAAGTTATGEAAATYTIDPAVTTLEWTATKVTGAHNGTVNITSGEIGVNQGAIVKGAFDIDLNTIAVLDIEDPKMNGDLVGHLKSPDFFSVDVQPVGKFEVTKVEALTGVPGSTHTISGNLTLKNITKEISFPAKVTITNNELTAEAEKIVLDRTWWDIKFRSAAFFADLGDKLIHDEFVLSLRLTARLAGATASN